MSISVLPGQAQWMWTRTMWSPLPDAQVRLVRASDARLVRANMPVLVERAVGRGEFASAEYYGSCIETNMFPRGFRVLAYQSSGLQHDSPHEARRGLRIYSSTVHTAAIEVLS